MKPRTRNQGLAAKDQSKEQTSCQPQVWRATVQGQYNFIDQEF